jgi:hypothetical protein
MGAIQNLSDLLYRLTLGGGSQQIFVYKDARVGGAAAAAAIAGRLISLWQYDGSQGFGAVASASGTVYDNTTNGGMKQTDPAGGNQLWLVGVSGACLAQGTLILLDRLVAESGNSGTVTSAQTLTACTTGSGRYSGAESAGNQIWIEITTQIGATSTTVTCSYTNQDGTSGRTTTATAFGNTGFREAQRYIVCPLQAGDTGVRSVESVTVLATTGTAGDFSVCIVRPLAYLPQTAIGQGVVRDMVSGVPGLIEVKTDACLTWAWYPNTTTIPSFFGHIVLVER